MYSSDQEIELKVMTFVQNKPERIYVRVWKVNVRANSKEHTHSRAWMKMMEKGGRDYQSADCRLTVLTSEVGQKWSPRRCVRSWTQRGRKCRTRTNFPFFSLREKRKKYISIVGNADNVWRSEYILKRSSIGTWNNRSSCLSEKLQG